MEEKKVPALRFRGFDNAWEQRHLGEIVERVTRKNENLESTLPLTISAQYGLIDQNEFFDKRIASKDVSGYFLIRRGEFAYNKSTSTDAPWGAIKCLERYENGVLSTLYIVFRIIDEKKLNSNYLAFYYDTDLWHRGVQAIAAEGARNHGLLNIAPVDFFETTLAIPQDIFEQQKIGLFFKQLDHLISLHQRKLEMLKKVKKSMLEKMFPKNDAKVPEVRFSDFTDAWEQRRLGELADKVTEKNTLLAKTEVLTNSAEFGIINQREFFDHDIVNENNIGGYYIVRERDFVYNPRISVSAPVGPINCNKLGKSGVMSPLYTVFRVHDIDSVYLEYFFKTSRWHSFMRFNGDSGVRSDRFSIKTELFYKMPIPITKYCEQVKIGKYFSQLDHLISLHQRKLEKLKNIKKSMLEKMFII